MPYAVKGRCKYPGCKDRALSGKRYCEYHMNIIKQMRQKEYDQGRGSAAKRGYDRNWSRYRRLYLSRHPLCVNYAECHNLATVVDHIVPVNKGGSFWDSANHQPMCESCHNQKRSTEDKK